jgi:hypothetical protein
MTSLCMYCNKEITEKETTYTMINKDIHYDCGKMIESQYRRNLIDKHIKHYRNIICTKEKNSILKRIKRFFKWLV